MYSTIRCCSRGRFFLPVQPLLELVEAVPSALLELVEAVPSAVAIPLLTVKALLAVVEAVASARAISLLVAVVCSSP